MMLQEQSPHRKFVNFSNLQYIIPAIYFSVLHMLALLGARSFPENLLYFTSFT